MAAGLLLHQAQRSVEREGGLVRTERDQRVEDVGDGDDASFERNIGAAQAVRVAAAVPLLVVAESNDAGGFEQFVVVLADDLGTHHRVLVHDLPFFGVELAGFEQDGVGDADLADVVHRRRVEDDVGRFFPHAVRQGDQAGVVAHAQHVVAGFVVLEFGGAAEAPDDLLAGGEQFQSALADHALEFP
ncbi:hypothetical protein SDC9_160346 [bioreactor metagenome]|uniref:Uncharacterized protein n=1 Tax=bioreactor metagenome TaxID=1076179 RepID=A0A645FHA8_9ZZZZ